MDRFGGITKTGDRSLRRLLIIGATCVICYARTKAPARPTGSRRFSPISQPRLVTVALANMMARIA